MKWLLQTRQPIHFQVSIRIEQGVLVYVRENGALTQIDIDQLRLAELRVLNQGLYWYLVDEQGNFVLLPESLADIGVVRRYLSSWRGFNYDGLLRFDASQQQTLRLWPLADRKAA
ncbi:hypothetical protein [Reinekea sp. G2M2-21]|uniref:hypothetical protein n=1 Tax=Reinekea sp. G2M2-21 TaxID=2788942 RepID=UPI0018AACB0E|nr:hypothetical protein [Reinekea sp. G2M2-21]